VEAEAEGRVPTRAMLEGDIKRYIAIANEARRRWSRRRTTFRTISPPTRSHHRHLAGVLRGGGHRSRNGAGSSIRPVDRFIDNAGVQLYVEVRGNGPRHVLFAHGWISSRRMWYDVVGRVDPAAFTLHLLDFRGAGRSDRPDYGHDLEGYAGDLRAAIASIDAPVTVVAHSMGGKIAQYVALAPPENLEKLVLIAPGTPRAYTTSERHRQMALDAFGSRVRIERFQRAAIVRDVSRQALERIVDDALIAQREAWFGWYDHGRNRDFSDRVSGIKLPCLAVAGQRDPLVAPSRVKRDVAHAIPGCLFVTLRDAGHNLPIEAPAEVAAMIEHFV